MTEDPGEVRSVAPLTLSLDRRAVHAQAICAICVFVWNLEKTKKLSKFSASLEKRLELVNLQSEVILDGVFFSRLLLAH